MFLMTGCIALGFLCFMILEDYLHKLYLETHCKSQFYQQYLHTNCTWNHLQKLHRFLDVYIARKCRNSIISFVYSEKQYAMKESVAIFFIYKFNMFQLTLDIQHLCFADLTFASAKISIYNYIFTCLLCV